MPKHRFIRITHVEPSGAEYLVSFYEGDTEKQIAWKGPPPCAGDIFEIDGSGIKGKIASAVPGSWIPDTDGLRWRKPVKPNGFSRMEILRRRQIIRRAVRDYLDGDGYIEIDAPMLVRGTTPDLAVESFPLEGHYLVTSTEYQIKRLIIGGFEKIYSLTQNFRLGDAGSFRNPEFTMLEWDCAGAGLEKMEQDIQGFTRQAMQALGMKDVLSYQGQTIDMASPWERLSVIDAVNRHTGANIADLELPSLRIALASAGLEIRPRWAEDGDFLFSLLVDHIQPQLGRQRPVFLTDWPLYQATCAKRNEARNTAERSELFIAGIELGDGYVSHTDAALQTRIFEEALERRRAQGRNPVELDHKFIGAMRLGAPSEAGMALGFDRLVMLLTDQPNIANTLAFAWDEL